MHACFKFQLTLTAIIFLFRSWDLESSKYSNELKSDDRDRHYDKRRSYHVSSQSSYKRKQEEISFNTKRELSFTFYNDL